MVVKKFRQGAASYYMVIVCALLFGVITAGFITLMLSEVRKSSENNLSQSAYDSAIVGIEDAKIFLVKYTNETETTTYKDALREGCVPIGKALGRVSNEDDPVPVQEVSTGSSTTVQEYTCVQLDFKPYDYLATLTGSNPIRLIPLNSTDSERNIKSIRISWYSSDNLGTQTTSFSNNVASDRVNFSDDASNPPVLVASIYQTGENFKLEDFSDTSTTGGNSYTNRGTLWLTPTDDNYDNTAEEIYDAQASNYYLNEHWPLFSGTSTAKERTNILTKQALLDSNDHSKSNNAFPVRCANNSEANGLDYLCSVVIELPDPVESGGRIKDDLGSFLLSLSLPYAQPDTDIKVEMSNNDGSNHDGFKDDGEYDALQFQDVQIKIDSTGRANDVYARVESRVEYFNSNFPFPDYAMSALGEGSSGGIDKNFTTSSKDGDGCWYSVVSGGSNSSTAESCPST